MKNINRWLDTFQGMRCTYPQVRKVEPLKYFYLVIFHRNY